MEDILVSIIIPVYNSENYLEKCIGSAINQSYKNIEIILVDDYSTDNSYSICDAYRKKDNRISLIKTKGKGVSAARNTGMCMSRGKYIQFLDSDDELPNNSTEILLKGINGADLCVGNYLIDKNAAFDKLDSELWDVEKYANEIILDNVYENIANYPWNKLYKTDVIKQNNITFDENISLSEDAIFNFQYLKYVRNISIVSDCVCIHYVRENSLLSQKYEAKELYDIHLKKYYNYKNIYIKNGLYEKNKDVIATKLLYTYLIISEIYQKMEGNISEMLHNENNRRNREFIKQANAGNLNYKIYKFLFSHNIMLGLIIFCRLKSLIN